MVLPLRLLYALVLALGALPVKSEAQVPFEACRDRDDRPIPGVVDNTMAYAGVATVQNGQLEGLRRLLIERLGPAA